VFALVEFIETEFLLSHLNASLYSVGQSLSQKIFLQWTARLLYGYQQLYLPSMLMC